MSFPQVSELLPQDPPMIVIDELVSYNEATVDVVAQIRAGQPWVQAGRVPATFCIEYMAQTIGCLAGMKAREEGRKLKIGFLLGTRELTLNVDYLYVGDQLRIHAKHVFGDEKLGSFSCELRRGDELVATATLNVFAGNLDEVLQ